MEELNDHSLCGFKITSAFEHPSFWDLILFCCWSKSHPKQKSLWAFCCEFLWPKVVFVAGQLINQLALANSNLPLARVPLLASKGKKGRFKKAPWVNKVILLQKVRSARHHRAVAMKTHTDLVTQNDSIIKSEHLLATALYMQQCNKAFQGVKHIAVHWDPSQYDCPTFVGIAYAVQNGKSCYLPIQNMVPVQKSEVLLEMQQLAAKKKLTRIEGYGELRALSHALKGIGYPLEFFQLPNDVHWKPLGPNQSREYSDGIMFVADKASGTKIAQLPPSFDINQVPLLCSISDQGGINRASLDYMCFKLFMPVLTLWDPFHRAWNDLRDSLKKDKGSLFKCMLSFSLFWNTSYGPNGSKEWFARRKIG